METERIILKIEVGDLASAQIDFLDDLEIASSVIASIIRTRRVPALTWSTIRGPFYTCAIEGITGLQVIFDA